MPETKTRQPTPLDRACSRQCKQILEKTKELDHFDPSFINSVMQSSKKYNGCFTANQRSAIEKIFYSWKCHE